MDDRDSRTGFTITEILVTMAILGLLVALILPAVQQSRESARRLVCQNNLKQIGLSIANHVESHQTFPSASAPVSGLRRILTGLGHGSLYNDLLNFKNMTPAERRAVRLFVPELVCPDDPLHTIGTGNSNYYMNDGTILHDNDPYNGYRQDTQRDTRPADVPDGLTNTAAFSERLVSGASIPSTTVEVMDRETKRYYWFTRNHYGQRGQELLAVNECRTNRTTTFPQYNGTFTNMFDSHSIQYNHLLTPNEPACYNGDENESPISEKFLVPPSSLHPGGVNLLLMDGSVRFLNEGLDEVAWRALGTANGNESFTF